MKVKLWGIWNVRWQEFEFDKSNENYGQVWIYLRLADAKKKLFEMGRYAPDSGVLRRVMPIYLTPYDNKQIFEALKIKE